MTQSTKAQEKRALAVRARHYAGAVTLEADRQRLLNWAVELEGEALRLEGDTGLDDAAKRRPAN